MPRPDAPPLTRAVVVRGIGFALAIALGAVAVWLIVTGSTSPRRIEIGVLAGLWGLLLGAYTMFGARRHVETTVLSASTDVERRTPGGLEPAAQAEARRAFEERLEHLLRTEISNSVNREVGDLRREVTQLRHELLEKVGGQLRLERIETTRLIGSDLEALHHEVRELKTARDAVSARPVVPPRPVVEARPVVEPAVAHTQVETPRVDPVDAARAIEAQAAAERARAEAARAEQAKAERERIARETAEREQAARRKAAEERAAREKAAAERVAREKAAAAERERVAREKAEREKAERVKAEREKAERERVARERAAAERVAQQKAAAAAAAAAASAATATNGASKDPFASLPRITPFTDFELDPVDTVNGVATPDGNGHHVAADDDGPAYTGRRRAGGADDATTRHSRHAAPDAASQDPDRSGDADANNGRRRRRHADGDEGIDLLSQLLSRESAEH